jgi:hypothetical protein
LLIAVSVPLHFAVATCAYGNGDDSTFKNDFGLSAEEASEARTIIVLWLQCQECVAGELQAVVHLGKVAVPTLAIIVQDGPSPAKLQEVRQQLSENYDSTQQYLANRPQPEQILMSREQYVAHSVLNLINLYKVRAALALGRIGGPEARSALLSAFQTADSDTVTDALKEALANVH